jgi:uncharacterized membrane protein YedE/YeeE
MRGLQAANALTIFTMIIAILALISYGILFCNTCQVTKSYVTGANYYAMFMTYFLLLVLLATVNTKFEEVVLYGDAWFSNDAKASFALADDAPFCKGVPPGIR